MLFIIKNNRLVVRHEPYHSIQCYIRCRNVVSYDFCYLMKHYLYECCYYTYNFAAENKKSTNN